MSRSVHLVSLGCPKNQVDSETTLGALGASGLRFESNPEKADLLLVNTCGFVTDAKEESIDTILQLAKQKEVRPGVRLAVMGCLSERYRDSLLESIPEIDHIFGVADLPTIMAELAPSTSLPDPDSIVRALPSNTPWAYLKIAEGCSNTCSFCAIPAIRGPYKSRPLDQIVAEAKELAKRGIKELILVAQDSTLYGADLHIKEGLATLLEELATIDGVDWIRVMYLYPGLVTDRLLDVMAASPKIAPYFDIPFQHASDNVLRAMRRPETNASIRALVERIRQKVPNAAIRTAFIVGFPGETEEDFNELLALVRDVRFDHLGAFVYSPEEGTLAEKLPNRVDEEMAQERYQQLMALQREIATEMAAGWIGKQVEVMVNPFVDEGEAGENLLTGRIQTQAPEVDGSVILDQVEALPGQRVTVTIVAAHDYDLVAKGDD